MGKIIHRKDQNHPDYPHGTHAGYRSGCKCNHCLVANNIYKKEYGVQLKLRNPAYAESLREAKRRFRKTPEGKAYYNSTNSKRRELIKCKTTNNALLKLIYMNCPIGYSVDHIYPLSKGGLHTPENLQYLPTEINSAKCDKIDFPYEAYTILWQDVIEMNLHRLSEGSE